jgi:hypothetical protein
VLPISDIPPSLREFARYFRIVFKHPAQREHFETLLTGLIASENKTVAGIHQRLVGETGYRALHNFMTESPWDHDLLRQKRLEWAAERLAREEKGPRVVAIDSTLVHHTGDTIYGVYWFWDYVNHNFCLGQKLVLATFVAPERILPLGMEVYHRGFLSEQKLYLEHTKPRSDAPQSEWDEYDELVREYEKNRKEFRTQLDLAGDLVDETERHKIPVDAYVLDGGFLDSDLMDKIESYDRAWVSRLAKNRLVQLPSGKFDTVEVFAKSLPKESFAPVTLKTRSGEERTYWAFCKNMKIKFWKKLRVVITYDNAELTGEPRVFVSNKLNWIQAQKILQPYLFRGPIEHFFRDEKQEIGFEDCQQRVESAVLRFWELCLVAYTFLEMVIHVDYPDEMQAPPTVSIGQKIRFWEMQILQSFVSLVADLTLEGRAPKEIITHLLKKRLNCLAC